MGIESITVDPTPTAVYNLEVDGTFTYFAEGVWVHNNSCSTVAGWLFRPLKWTEDRAAHVRKHNYNDLKKDIHGVFDHDGVLMAEEAWFNAERLGLQLDASSGINVPMGRVIGWEGGYEGSGAGLSTIRVVVNKAGEVISAYPVQP